MIWALPRPPCRDKTTSRVLLSIAALTTIARRVCQDVGERRYCWSTSRLDRLRRPFEESPLRVDGVSLRNPVVNTCTIWISAGVQSNRFKDNRPIQWNSNLYSEYFRLLDVPQVLIEIGEVLPPEYFREFTEFLFTQHVVLVRVETIEYCRRCGWIIWVFGFDLVACY